MFRKNKKTKKISKETFDEWKKRADDLIDKYVAEEGANLFNPTKENKNKKDTTDKVIYKESEGDSLSEARIRQSEQHRKDQKSKIENKKKQRQKKLRQAMILKEVLDEPVSKRSKAKRV